jgi:hypothetical protein
MTVSLKGDKCKCILYLSMPDEPLTNEQIELSSPLPINTTGSEPVTTPFEPLESSTTTDTPSLAN